MMERFCLSRKRLHLFADDNTIRAGGCGGVTLYFRDRWFNLVAFT
jgi:hypothetical protein